MEVLVLITTESSNANALRMAKLLIENKNLFGNLIIRGTMYLKVIINKVTF